MSLVAVDGLIQEDLVKVEKLLIGVTLEVFMGEALIHDSLLESRGYQSQTIGSSEKEQAPVPDRVHSVESEGACQGETGRKTEPSAVKTLIE